MGFLSRKSKSAPAPVPAEEPHPIVEELQAMEDAVPERSQPAGPVAGGSPPAHPPEGQPSMPPAGEASVGPISKENYQLHQVFLLL